MHFGTVMIDTSKIDYFLCFMYERKLHFRNPVLVRIERDLKDEKLAT